MTNFDIDTYKSLFEIIEPTKEFQVYEGSLDSIFNDIIDILKKKVKSKKDYSILAFHSPRIIRGLVDCKQDNPEDPKLLELLRQGIFVSFRIYRQYDDPVTSDEVVRLRDSIARVDETILKRKVSQYEDTINLVASSPQFSQASANRLYELIECKDAIMFATGHGGINTGLDVALRYEELSGKRIIFYPIRYSRTGYKGYKDQKPCLTKPEIEYLREKVKSKKIIVFDENSNTGTGIGTVTKIVEKEIAQNQKVEKIYNIDSSKPGDWVALFNELLQNS
ncbi:hypothetical protein HOI26_04850 [Candidatus Woesearchaeota archaeon]|mgnify:CR=1 FL=1|jgi:hypothetical protein|nr:hypothetical protein [Candidatus Woesearchaeota archaeon]MBT5740399.1 hypothetical protein [Candidatus Woesearchaeota archaeon]